MIELAKMLKEIAEDSPSLMGRFPGGYHVDVSKRPDDLPHLVVNAFKLQGASTTSTGTVESYLVQIDAYAVGMAVAAELATLIKRVFNRKSNIELPDGSGLVSLIYKNGDCIEDETRSPDGDIVGHGIVEFDCTYYSKGV